MRFHSFFRPALAVVLAAVSLFLIPASVSAAANPVSISGTSSYEAPAVGDPSGKVPVITPDDERVKVDVCRWDHLLDNGYSERYLEATIKPGNYILYAEFLISLPNSDVETESVDIRIDRKSWRVLNLTREGSSLRVCAVSPGVKVFGEDMKENDSNSFSTLIIILFCVMAVVVIAAVVLTVVISRRKTGKEN